MGWHAPAGYESQKENWKLFLSFGYSSWPYSCESQKENWKRARSTGSPPPNHAWESQKENWKRWFFGLPFGFHPSSNLKKRIERACICLCRSCAAQQESQKENWKLSITLPPSLIRVTPWISKRELKDVIYVYIHLNTWYKFESQKENWK